jgi:hypothetical protein
MTKILCFALALAPSLALAGRTQKAVQAQVLKAYKAAFGAASFEKGSLHDFAVHAKLVGNGNTGTFTTVVVDRNANMGAGMPNYAGTYSKKPGGGYRITIDPNSR